MKDTWTGTRGASNSQGPDKGHKDWQRVMLEQSRTDTWRLQGLVN